MSIIEPGTMIVSLLGFLISFWIVKRVAYQPLANMMEQRRKHIEDQIQSAERDRAEAERLLAEQRKLLEQTRNEVRDMLDQARVRADEQARQILEEARAEADRLIAEGRQLIERERAEAMAGAMETLSELAVELTTKLLRSRVNETTHREMVSEAEKHLEELVS
ncbi:F0F1 ATP synthase subunit B [Alicyclobacillus sp.]|uniref:F0F1 ATP synthase subunit B n=1 Tax=Alicyclobacillus sp. TaxID=61169 RepID=UPI0025BB085B|nr:F0F1 ATP synthase subunit B [Alicyclobacillus sp.]